MHSATSIVVTDSASRPAWGPVLAMSLGAFVLVASEFMPVSLLTPVAAELGVTEGQAGQAISISGAFALVTSLSASWLAGQIDRKVLLLAMTMLMIVSGTLAAFAPDYFTFMVARALIGVAIGGFWSLSAATAMQLVPPADVPRALAIINGGNALATVVAAPLGSYLGALYGWRGAFFFLIPFAVIAFAWKLARFSPMPASPRSGSGNVFGLLKRPVAALGMAAASLLFIGQFTLFTYLRPFLETVTRVDPDTLSLMLLVVGIAGLVGTWLIGPTLKGGVYRTLIVIPLVMAGLAVALLCFGDSLPATVVLVAAWGLVATAAPVGWWTWLSITLPNDAERGGGLMVAVVQLAIGGGASLGGILFDLRGYRASFGVSAALLALASVCAALTARAAQNAGTTDYAD
jgi:predicted MFS family arabinose efflux permease